MTQNTVIMKANLPVELAELLKAGPCRLEPVKDEDGKLLYAIVTPTGRGPKQKDPRRTQPL